MDRIFGPAERRARTDLEVAMAEADGVINATTIGMTGHTAGSCVPAGLFGRPCGPQIAYTCPSRRS